MRTHMQARHVRVHVGMHRDTRMHEQTPMRSYAHVHGRKQPLQHLAADSTGTRTHMQARHVRVHVGMHRDTRMHEQTPMRSHAHVRGRKQPLKHLAADSTHTRTHMHAATCVYTR
jgi:hypothetical protein